MNTRMRLALAAIVASGIPVAANAAGFYVGAGVGSATYGSSQFLDCIQNCDSGGNFDDSDIAYNLFVGYSVTDAVAVEIGYQDWGDLEDTFYPSGPSSPETTLEPSMFTVMAVGTAPIADNFSVFGKAGVAFMSIDGAEGSGEFRVSETSDTQDLALGGGIQWDIGQFGIRAEALWVDAEDADKSMMIGLAGLYKFSL